MTKDKDGFGPAQIQHLVEQFFKGCSDEIRARAAIAVHTSYLLGRLAGLREAEDCTAEFLAGLYSPMKEPESTT